MDACKPGMATSTIVISPIESQLSILVSGRKARRKARGKGDEHGTDAKELPRRGGGARRHAGAGDVGQLLERRGKTAG